ncbi:protein kinase C delta type-like [Xenopus laevis]|uniref:Protein kinase C delta type-like n=1 Tax=Xenopus laevis TaxID=8355 RepID=A0A8J1KK77_XENLA|nr:protein kinase C delta type-like [Xenopus laevis]
MTVDHRAVSVNGSLSQRLPSEKRFFYILVIFRIYQPAMDRSKNSPESRVLTRKRTIKEKTEGAPKKTKLMGNNMEEKSLRQVEQEVLKREREREPAEAGRSGASRPCVEAQMPKNPKNITNYKFHKELGKGSFGKVMLASLNNCRDQVAIKVIRKTTSVEDILTEARTLRITGACPFLCHGYGAFQTQMHAFLVMEFMSGGTLEQLINKRGCLNRDIIQFYSAEMIIGLQYLHSCGIVHRDLKPPNILLSAEGHIKISDFGLAVEGIFGNKKMYDLVGSYHYMAPEIHLMSGYGAGVDWWAFAIILCQMAARRSPFHEGLTLLNIIESVTLKQPSIPEDISPDLKSLMQELFEKNPDKRLGTSGDIRKHPFYRSVDWAALENRKIPPPFKPQSQVLSPSVLWLEVYS